MRALMTVLLCLSLAMPAAAADWQVDPAHSRLGFSGTQQGGTFEGHFERWSAQIRFDPRALEDSVFDVHIEVASIDTGSRERDQYLPQKEWLDANTYPTARFRASAFSARDGEEYLAHGQLTLRGITRPVELRFRWTEQGERAELHGQASLDRTAFGVDQGEFADTDVVGREVRVSVDLVLRRQGQASGAH